MNLENLLTEMEKPKQIKDTLGQVLNINDLVLYSPRVKQSTGLRQGQILNIDYDKNILIIDTCRINVLPTDVVKINDLLSNLTGNEYVPEDYSSLRKNTSIIYLFYCILPEQQTDKLLLLKPKYTGETGLFIEYNNLIKQYPDIIFIPFNKQVVNVNFSFEYAIGNLNEFKNDTRIQDYNTRLKETAIEHCKKFIFTRPLKKVDEKSFDFSLSTISSIKDTQLLSNSKSIPLNTLLDFEFSELAETERTDLFDAKQMELTIHIPGQIGISFTNNVLTKNITVSDIYNAYCFYWKHFIPNKNHIYSIVKTYLDTKKIEPNYILTEFLDKYEIFKTIKNIR